jgi:hypothetical protein
MQDAPAVGGGAAIQMLQMPLLLWVLENTTLSYVSAAWPVQVSLARIRPHRQLTAVRLSS